MAETPKSLKSMRSALRARVEAARLPSETYQQAALRLHREQQQTPTATKNNTLSLLDSPASVEAIPSPTPVEPLVLPTGRSRRRRPAPSSADQADFFLPALYDAGTRDSRSIMDVAVFRLSKKDKRAGEMIRYELPDGYVEVTAGPYGMASVWDYDIVLMMVSHLTIAMNRYREDQGEKPGRLFRPHVSDILKFARRGDGSRQVDELESALDRLRGTTIKTVRESSDGGRPTRQVQAEGLITGYRVISRTDTNRISSVEIEAPQWLYREVVDGQRPEVLTVHPDYFLIDPGIGRFIYRLARRAAGKDSARWSFQTLYDRSGSAGSFKEFCRLLRHIVKADELPEYTLREDTGKDGPVLVMQHRNHSESLEP